MALGLSGGRLHSGGRRLLGVLTGWTKSLVLVGDTSGLVEVLEVLGEVVPNARLRSELPAFFRLRDR